MTGADEHALDEKYGARNFLACIIDDKKVYRNTIYSKAMHIAELSRAKDPMWEEWLFSEEAETMICGG